MDGAGLAGAGGGVWIRGAGCCWTGRGDGVGTDLATGSLVTGVFAGAEVLAAGAGPDWYFAGVADLV